MKLHIFHIIGIIAIFQSFFLGIILLRNRRGTRRENRIFSALLFAFAVIIGCSFTHSWGIGGYFIGYHKVIFGIGQIGFLIAPLLYFYFLSVLDRDFLFKKRDVIHLLPFTTAVIYFPIRLDAIPSYNPWQSPLKLQYSAAILLQEAVYIALILLLMRKYQISFKKLFSKIGDARLAWFRIFICGFILIWHLKLQSFILLDVYRRWGFCPYAESLYFLVMFLFFNTLLALAFRYPDLFSHFRRYRSSDLSASDINGYREKLISYMTNEKPYLEPSLTLPDLARRLSISKSYLSQVVNESFDTNFCDFVNSYRIDASKELISDRSNGHKNILAIAYQVGFHSKSAFNNAFKKHTGLTPREYKNNTFSANNISS